MSKPTQYDPNNPYLRRFGTTRRDPDTGRKVPGEYNEYNRPICTGSGRGPVNGAMTNEQWAKAFPAGDTAARLRKEKMAEQALLGEQAKKRETTVFALGAGGAVGGASRPEVGKATQQATQKAKRGEKPTLLKPFSPKVPPSTFAHRGADPQKLSSFFGKQWKPQPGARRYA